METDGDGDEFGNSTSVDIINNRNSNDGDPGRN